MRGRREWSAARESRRRASAAASGSPVGRMRSGASYLAVRERSTNSSMETGSKGSGAGAASPDSSAFASSLPMSVTTLPSTMARCSTSCAADQRSGAGL